MQSLKALRSAGMIAMLSIAGLGAASAADIIRAPQYMPPPPPPPPEPMGGFYLRGDIGGGMYNADKLGLDPALVNAPSRVYIVDPCGNLCAYIPTVKNSKTLSNSIENTIFAGVGAGYQFNSWFRADATVEYRLPADYKFKEQVLETGTGISRTYGSDTTGKLSAVVAMLNGYVDLGTWYKFTPFVGAGVGLASINMHNGKLTDITDGGSLTASSDKKTNGLAWALHAGVAYDINPNMKLEVGYRYLNLGEKIDSGNFACSDCSPPFKARITGLTSHDIKAGLRWNLSDVGIAPPPPVAYPAPAPVYAPPPLTRKY